jgi:hypothetical protein
VALTTHHIQQKDIEKKVKLSRYRLGGAFGVPRY